MLALTIAVCLGILLIGAMLGGFYAVMKHPPIFRAEIYLPAPNIAKEMVIPDLEPIPEDILAYIDQESEEHARTIRRHRARYLRQELGSWESAYRALQREDVNVS